MRTNRKDDIFMLRWLKIDKAHGAGHILLCYIFHFFEAPPPAWFYVPRRSIFLLAGLCFSLNDEKRKMRWIFELTMAIVFIILKCLPPVINREWFLQSVATQTQGTPLYSHYTKQEIKQYHASGKGGAHSPPARLHCLQHLTACFIQNGQQDLEICLTKANFL